MGRAWRCAPLFVARSHEPPPAALGEIVHRGMLRCGSGVVFGQPLDDWVRRSSMLLAMSSGV